MTYFELKLSISTINSLFKKTKKSTRTIIKKRKVLKNFPKGIKTVNNGLFFKFKRCRKSNFKLGTYLNLDAK